MVEIQSKSYQYGDVRVEFKVIFGEDAIGGIAFYVPKVYGDGEYCAWFRNEWLEVMDYRDFLDDVTNEVTALVANDHMAPEFLRALAEGRWEFNLSF